MQDNNLLFIGGIRAGAQAAVISFHTFPAFFRPFWGQGYQAVSLFFWLSGFMCERTISAMLVRPLEQRINRTPRLLRLYGEFLHRRCFVLVVYLWILKKVYFERLPGNELFGAAEFRSSDLFSQKWNLTWWTPLHTMRNYSRNESTWFFSVILLHWIACAFPLTLALHRLSSKSMSWLLALWMGLIHLMPVLVPHATPWQCFYNSPMSHIFGFALGVMTSRWVSSGAGKVGLSWLSKVQSKVPGPFLGLVVDGFSAAFIWWGCYVSQTTYHPPQGYPDHVYRVLNPFTILFLIHLSDLGAWSLTHRLLSCRFIRAVAPGRVLLSLYLLHVPFWLYSLYSVQDHKPFFLLTMIYVLAVVAEKIVIRPVTSLSKASMLWDKKVVWSPANTRLGPLTWSSANPAPAV